MEEKDVNNNEEESKIKTNVGFGGPVNTADVLEQLRKMQKDLEKQVEENPTIKLDEDYVKMTENEVNEINKETEQAENTGGEEKEESVIENSAIEEKNEEQKDENQEQKENIEEKAETPEEKLEKVKEQIKEIENIQYEEPEKINFDEMYAKLFGTKPILTPETTTISAQNEENIEQKNQAFDILKDNISVFEECEEYKKTTYKFIGIVFNTYIIIEMDKEMYIIDQHAAHERIMYEKVKKNYYSEETKDSQMLLLPDIITLSHKEMEIAKDNMEMFEKAGFSLEEFGDNTIKLTGVPSMCIDLDNKELFLETLDEINTVARTAKQEKEEKFIATVACKAAVKANMVLDKAEVESLMDKLLELPNPFTCPHGRPTAIKMSKYDIERKFARK